MDNHEFSRRYRIREDNIEVQEVNGMMATKVFWDIYDFSRFIKERLKESDRERFADCTFIPIDISVNTHDLTLEATILATKDP